MYAIEYTREAELDLFYFRKRDQQIIVTAIERQLRFEPLTITTNRFRRNPRISRRGSCVLASIGSITK